MAWLLSLARTAALIFIIIKLIGAIWDYLKNISKSSHELERKKRLSKYKFEKTTAVLISRERKSWTETKRDYLNDRHDVEYEWNLIMPDVEKHIHTKAYKEVLHEGPLTSCYEVRVNGVPHYLESEKHTEKTLPAYYNTSFPIEVYFEEDVIKSYSWTDDDEKKFRKENLAGYKIFIGIWAVILVVFLIVF